MAAVFIAQATNSQMDIVPPTTPWRVRCQPTYVPH
ncbi:MAG: hypothetical protein Q610_ECBC00209G0002, partial [Escherichia coli DORA_B_14]